jgi:PAS domain S-box-containing protein/putative nucleotidyltransferase with HDIG domain
MMKNEKTKKTKSPDTAKKRKEVEKTLHHGEERYRSILDNIEDGYYEVDIKGNFTFFNNSMCQILGYPQEEMMGMNNRQFTDKENQKKLFKTFNKVYRTGESTKEFDWQVIRKDGTERFIEVSVSLQKNPSGQPIGFHGIARDITDRKKVEESLKKSEDQYRLLADNITEHIWLMDLNTKRTIFVSPSVEKMYGYTSDEIIKLSFKKILTAESLQKILDLFSTEMPKALANSLYKPRYSLELEACHKDGHLLWIENILSIIQDENGKPALILGETRDITERKKAEEKLRYEEQRFRTLAEQSSDIIVIVNRKGTITYENQAIERILGFKPEERIGGGLFDLVHPDDLKYLIDIAIKLARDRNAPVLQSEVRLRHKDGSWRVFEVTGTNLINNTIIEGGIVNLRDITERMRTEEKLRNEEKRFRALAEQSSDIILMVNREGIITYENQAVYILGINPEERIGANVFERVHPDDLKLMTDSFHIFFSDTNAPVQKAEVRIRHADGSWRTFEATGSNLVRNNVIEAAIVNIRDITERKKAEEQLQKTLESLKKAVGTTIQVLVSAVESRDPYTAGHQLRVADLARAIATEMGLTQDKIEGIRMAGIIHDIGKLSIPAEILSKPTKLTGLEFSLIKVHSQSGYEMLKDVESPWPLAEIVYQHHERMNGSGYPRNLKGDEILLESRIMAVADVVEAMASHRPYRPTLGIEAALEEIEKNKGIIYDNTVSDACIKLFREKGYQLT